MQFVIDDDWTLEQIFAAFSVLFPFLKLRIVAAYDKEKPHPPSDLVLLNMGNSIKQLRKISGRNHITIDQQMTVTDLVGKFKSVYGIEIKVLRKSGRTWLETSRTADWTLQKQNEVGESLEK